MCSLFAIAKRTAHFGHGLTKGPIRAAICANRRTRRRVLRFAKAPGYGERGLDDAGGFGRVGLGRRRPAVQWLRRQSEKRSNRDLGLHRDLRRDSQDRRRAHGAADDHLRAVIARRTTVAMFMGRHTPIHTHGQRCLRGGLGRPADGNAQPGGHEDGQDQIKDLSRRQSAHSSRSVASKRGENKPCVLGKLKEHLDCGGRALRKMACL